ncbi:thioredoxin fold domain-containing protein [Oxalobacteraceae bacterium R-40]|uniref:Thioredoxin fold domain-containing protein n=1 Tax=Keguizhuia sedimenti TaxID=3064264 RepID=A0ABU1BMB5_9BURK|nr:thioredoxin fold domain-containing protein [Oxalobacteraceae bacterium R-40]
MCTMIRRILIAPLVLFLPLMHAYAKTDQAKLPPPVNLQHDGIRAEREGKPVVILFTLPDCSYCHVVRRNYLAPLLRNGEQPIIREVTLNGTASFRGFNGEPLTHGQFARSNNVRFVPTVMFFGPAGKQLTDPLSGVDSAGLYGGLLENAFSVSEKKLSGLSPNQQRNVKE